MRVSDVPEYSLVCKLIGHYLVDPPFVFVEGGLTVTIFLLKKIIVKKKEIYTRFALTFVSCLLLENFRIVCERGNPFGRTCT